MAKSPPLSFDDGLKQLKMLYEDPKFGLLSKTKFIDKAKAELPKLSRKVIKDFVENQQLQQTTTKSQFKGYFRIVAPPRSFQMDIFFMNSYKKSNKFFAFLILVDVLSRKMFIEPLKDKTMTSKLVAIKKVVNEIGNIRSIYTDDEFNKKNIKDYLESKNIRFSSVVSNEEHLSKGNKLGIVDVATRTIKRYIKRYMLSKDTTKFDDVLDDLVENYNTTKHTSLRNKTPEEVYDNTTEQDKILKDATEHNAELEKRVDLEIGDYVRKSVSKGKFEKEKQSFSNEVYVVFDKVGYKYKLIDENGRDVDGVYKYTELLKVDGEKLGVDDLITILDRHYGVKPLGKKGKTTKVDKNEKEQKEKDKFERRMKKEGVEANKRTITTRQTKRVK